MESTTPSSHSAPWTSPSRPISWTRNDPIANKPISSHPLYKKCLEESKAIKQDTYAVLMHAVRYLLKDRSYYVEIGDREFVSTSRHINPWNGGRDVPFNGLMRYGYDGVPGLEQLLDVQKTGTDLKLITEFMSILDILGEIVIFKVGQNTYYHLLEGSPLDSVQLPPFETMIQFAKERDPHSVNPFRRFRTMKDPRQRPRQKRHCNVHGTPEAKRARTEPMMVLEDYIEPITPWTDEDFNNYLPPMMMAGSGMDALPGYLGPLFAIPELPD